MLCISIMLTEEQKNTAGNLGWVPPRDATKRKLPRHAPVVPSLILHDLFIQIS